MSVLSKVLRLGEGRMVKRLKGVANYVDTLSDDVEKLTDEELRGKTAEFKARVEKGETLDDLLPEAFAVAREAAWRVLSQRPFEVQLMGGAALHFGNVAEMKTGEGKTLTCVLPAYLNALSGKGVHVVTVNDYLAKRDSEWMGQIYRFLGMTVGVFLLLSALSAGIGWAVGLLVLRLFVAALLLAALLGRARRVDVPGSRKLAPELALELAAAQGFADF